MSDDTSFRLANLRVPSKTKELSYALNYYISETKDVIRKPIYLGLASATNALEACTTNRLLRDVGRSSAPSICPEGNVRLHELCKACALFAQRSVALNWLDRSNPRTAWPPRGRYQLCTVAHLRRLNGHCHLCTICYFLVVKSSWTPGDLYNNWIYLEILPWRQHWQDSSIVLNASLYPSRGIVGQFSLSLLADNEAGNYADALARASHVPIWSNDNIERVREWLKSCLETHGACRTPNNEALSPLKRPSRILAVNDDRVRLICNWSESSDSKYLALSHMWGTDPKQQLQLVLSRLEEFQENIPWTELPFIFKEAIRIARQVGYDHIWIDSLCIIQDSASDWAAEAGKMAHVYGHADCTIAYLLPPQDVLTKPRQDPMVWTPCMLRHPSVASRGMYVCAKRDDWNSDSVRTEFGIDWLSPKDWPLFTRAWACQEYLLSPRILFAGHRNLMWECSELLSDELLGPMDEITGTTASKTHFSAVKSVTLPVTNMTEQLEFVQNWGMLVHHYRAGVLTQPKDRIMAFAGIAQAVRDSSGMTYLAGSWAQMFPLSFAWSVAARSDNTTMPELEPVVEPVPSWSWFSVPIPSPDKLTFQVVDELLRGLHYGEAGRIEPIYQATLISFEDRSQQDYTDASTTKGFHNFTGMTLNLAIRTWTGFLKDSPAPDSRYGLSMKCQLEKLMGMHYGYLQCDFDHPDTVHNPFNMVMTFGLLMQIRTGKLPGRGALVREPFLVGLIMQPEPSRKAYKRIGLWRLYLQPHLWNWDAEKFNSASIFDQLEGVRSEHIRLV
ncbi:hypothetical protein GT037_004203 [Alternaria burnsii]|uniref:Heterokaryon incompatibility domain-containing protein n=1 Tax=Alternaria burnsii TaxID=1187904 RepID=A0A8H7B8X6_9PLEO|nr:uncharacterized protein GT037_004203 [Alternaria burnsii]KAF7677344.1 hypothetical protein GT037_004203 [Alternaria burnsii]